MRCIPLLFAGTAFFAPLAFAQGPAPQEIQRSADRAMQKLSQAEAVIDRALQGRRITAGMPDPDTLIAPAADDMQTSFNAALADLKRYADSKGRQGGIDGMRRFERAAKEYQARVDHIVEKLGAVGNRISEGDIILDANLLNGMSPDDRREFQASLSPKAEAIYRKSAPQIFSSGLTPGVARQQLAKGPCIFTPSRFSIVAARAVDRRSFADKVLELLVPSANAATVVPEYANPTSLGLGCVGACSGSVGLGCVICVASAGGAVVTAYNGYKRCRDSCGTCHWYKPWRCACRAACAVGFVATLA